MAKGVAFKESRHFGGRKHGIEMNKGDEIRSGEGGPEGANLAPDGVAGPDRATEAVRLKPPARPSFELTGQPYELVPVQLLRLGRSCLRGVNDDRRGPGLPAGELE